LTHSTCNLSHLRSCRSKNGVRGLEREKTAKTDERKAENVQSLVEPLSKLFGFRPDFPTGLPEVVNDHLVQDLASVSVAKLETGSMGGEVGGDEEETGGGEVERHADTCRGRGVSKEKEKGEGNEDEPPLLPCFQEKESRGTE
jgi:hypothetical protein